jgi:hypothetical protein
MKFRQFFTGKSFTKAPQCGAFAFIKLGKTYDLFLRH